MGSRTAWVEQGNVGSRTAPVGWSANVVDQGVTLLASHRPRCMGFGSCQRTRGESGTGCLNKLSSHATRSGGRRRGNSAVQNGTVRSFFFFFFLCMKRRRFGENALFHLKMAPECAKFQISPQLSFVSFNCVPANFGPRLHSWPHFSLWSLASDLCNLALN